MISIFRIRSTTDMQFAFSYYYFLRELEAEITLEDIFDEFDSDRTGILSDRELRMFLAKTIYDLPVRLENLNELESEIISCKKNLDLIDIETVSEKIIRKESYYDKELPQVTLELFLECPHTRKKLEKIKEGRKKYKTTEFNDEEIEFQMIGSNVSGVIGQLDKIRRNQKKFLCINDDMNHAAKGNRLNFI
jgi:UDP-N-acetylglucosamine-lysosomal-enzyme